MWSENRSARKSVFEGNFITELWPKLTHRAVDVEVLKELLELEAVQPSGIVPVQVPKRFPDVRRLHPKLLIEERLQHVDG